MRTVLLCALLPLIISVAFAVLPNEIPVAAVFDEEGDPKLQLAFIHGVDRVNQVSISTTSLWQLIDKARSF